MRRSRRLLTDLREARLDLARGFLHLNLAEHPGSPFRREEGLALLDQSIAALREAETQITPTTVLRPKDGELVKTFHTKANAFREQLEAYNRTEANAREGLMLPLRLSFHELEELAQRVDHVGQIALNALADRLDVFFTVTLVGSVAVLGVMCLGVYQVGRRQQEAAVALRQSEQRLQQAQTVAHIGSWHLDLAQDRLTWSAEACRIFGRPTAPRTYEEFLACIHPDDHAALKQAWQATLGGAPYVLEHRILAGETVRWVHQVAALEYNDQGKAVACLGTVQDITDRKARDLEIERLTRLYATLSQINQAIVHTRSREELLQRVCEITAESGGFSLAWVGWLDPRTQEILPIAHAGDDSGYLDEIKVYADLRPEGCGPCGDCIRTGQPSVVNDFLRAERTQPWHQAALSHNLRAIAVFPIRVQNEIRGTLAVYDREAGGFRDKEIALLAEAAMELSNAIEQLENESFRQQAEAELMRTRNTLLEAQRIAHLGSFEFIAATLTTVWSEEEYHIYGLDPAGPSPAYEEMLARCIHPADANQLHETFTHAMQRKGVYELDHRIVRPDGTVRWVHDRAHPYFDPQGNLVRYVGTTLDITERKHSEEALRRSEERLNFALRAGHIGAWSVNLRDRTATRTLIQAAIFGYASTDDPWTLEIFLEHVLPEDRDRVRGRIQEGVAKQQDWEIECRIRRVDGEMRWILVAGGLERTPADPRSRISGIVQDITERKQVEEKLRTSEEQFRAMFELASIGMAQADPVDARWLRVNRKFCEITGYSEAELLRLRVPEITHPDDRTKDQELFQGVVRGEANDYRLEKRYIRKDTSLAWVNVNMTVIRDAAGRPVRTMATIEDITERVRAEQALRESEFRRTLALDAAKAGTWEWELATGKNVWSDELWRLYGLAPNSREPSFEAWRQTVHPEDRTPTERKLQDIVQQEAEISLEWRVNVPDGGERWLFSRGRPLRDSAGRIIRYLGVVIDISERRRGEQERASMEARMRQQQKLESIGTLASGVAHEINNPINGILNYAQLIQDRLPGDSPLTEFTGEIMHETQRVAVIVRNLLTFARNEKQSHSPARVADIVEAVLSLVRTVIRRDQITLSVNVPADLPQLKCRSQQIQQVIMNLVTNARDALNERYPAHHPDKVLSLDARLFEKAGRRWIRLTVEDRGTGIQPEVRERIFDPFFTTKGRSQGTGLGLSISHGIVKEHHGEWTVESEPDKFTRMHVDLPVDNGWNL